MIEAFDLGALHWLNERRSDGLTGLALVVTDLGGAALLTAFSLIGTGVLVLLRQGRPAVAFALTGLGTWGLSEATKALVARPRPALIPYLIPEPWNASFPSGHAICSMAIYLCFGLLIGRVLPRAVGWLPPLLGVALALAIGLTRPYLGVHYPTDVLAGWLAGVGCALIGAALALPREAPAP